MRGEKKTREKKHEKTRKEEVFYKVGYGYFLSKMLYVSKHVPQTRPSHLYPVFPLCDSK
jgi:hypothetical protein